MPSISSSQSVFDPAFFSFLRALKRNNERAWFEKNKPRYEEDVKEPLLEFIRAFQPALKKISPHLIADPRPVGGSMFRIYRDTRFSKDKTPYKTHAAAHFRHSAGKDVHAPGYYLHLEPGEVFFAGGIWRPEPDVAQKIRRAIAANGATWKKVVGNKKFASMAELGGESLVRPPKGFPADHPLVTDLKRKDFIASVTLSEKAACSPRFLADVGEAAEVLAPLMEFLALACGLPF
ncbi:MAG TPA: DUF2461 domain-containing protein [bacterium]|nr:DUF2461 domain-containing protein [bacterium]